MPASAVRPGSSGSPPAGCMPRAWTWTSSRWTRPTTRLASQYARAKGAQVELLGLWADRLAPTAASRPCTRAGSPPRGRDGPADVRKGPGPACGLPRTALTSWYGWWAEEPARSRAGCGSIAAPFDHPAAVDPHHARSGPGSGNGLWGPPVCRNRPEPSRMSAMKCPNDNSTLQMTDRQGIEIDYCPECRGVWLDRGELDKIIERSASWTPEPELAGTATGNGIAAAGTSPRRRSPRRRRPRPSSRPSWSSAAKAEPPGSLHDPQGRRDVHAP